MTQADSNKTLVEGSVMGGMSGMDGIVDIGVVGDILQVRLAPLSKLTSYQLHTFIIYSVRCASIQICSCV
jgi:hypothetical protein